MSTGISSKLFSKNFYDPKFERCLRNFRKVQKFKNERHNPKKVDAIKALGLSKNTISKYWKPESEPTPERQNFSSSPKIKAAISKVSDSDRDILNIILNVYLDGKKTFDCDLTFGEGKFYSNLPYPQFSFDQYPEKTVSSDSPKVEELDKADEIIPDNSLSSIIIDLPQEISKSGKGNVGAFKSMTHLAETYNWMLKLAEKKLRFASPGHSAGLLIVKVGDIIHKGETIWLSQIISELAMGEDYFTSLSEKFLSKIKKLNTVRFELVDKFLHRYKEEGIDKTDNLANRSVKAHDYYLVFRKKGEDPAETFYFISDEECRGNNLNGDLMLYDGYGPYVDSGKDKLRDLKRRFKHASIYEVTVSDRTPLNTLFLKAEANSFRETANSVLEKWKAEETYREYRDLFPLVFSRYAFESGQKLIDFINEKISEHIAPPGYTDKNNPRHKVTASFLKDMGIKYMVTEYKADKLVILNEESIKISEKTFLS